MDEIHLNLKPFCCPHSYYKCCRKSRLKEHVDQTHKKLRPIACPHCSLKFFSHSQCKSHVDLVHLKLKRFACRHCGEMCATNSSHKLHESSHDRSQKLEGHNDNCDKTFSLLGRPPRKRILERKVVEVLPLFR